MKTILFIIASLVAFSSSLIGLIMINNPINNIFIQDISLLTGTPFKNYFIPGILLIVMIGLPNMLVIYYFLKRSKKGYNWSMAGGIFIALFIIIQVSMDVPLHWVEIVFFVAAVMMVLITYQLKGKWAV